MKSVSLTKKILGITAIFVGVFVMYQVFFLGRSGAEMIRYTANDIGNFMRNDLCSVGFVKSVLCPNQVIQDIVVGDTTAQLQNNLFLGQDGLYNAQNELRVKVCGSDGGTNRDSYSHINNCIAQEENAEYLAKEIYQEPIESTDGQFAVYIEDNNWFGPSVNKAKRRVLDIENDTVVSIDNQYSNTPHDKALKNVLLYRHKFINVQNSNEEVQYLVLDLLPAEQLRELYEQYGNYIFDSFNCDLNTASMSIAYTQFAFRINTANSLLVPVETENTGQFVTGDYIGETSWQCNS